MANSIPMEGSDTQKTWRVYKDCSVLFKSWGAFLTSTSYTHSIDTLLETYSFHFKHWGFGKWLCCRRGRNLAGATLVLRRRLAIFLLVLYFSLFGMWGKSLAQNIEMENAFLDFEWYQDAWGCSSAFYGQHDRCSSVCILICCNGFSLALKWQMFHYFSKVGWDGAVGETACSPNLI